jgi:hypothetical protein
VVVDKVEEGVNTVADVLTVRVRQRWTIRLYTSNRSHSLDWGSDVERTEDLHIDMINAIIQKSGLESVDARTGSVGFIRTLSLLLTAALRLVLGMETTSSSEASSSSGRCTRDSLLLVRKRVCLERSLDFGRSGRGNMKMTIKPMNSERLDMTATVVSVD